MVFKRLEKALGFDPLSILEFNIERRNVEKKKLATIRRAIKNKTYVEFSRAYPYIYDKRKIKDKLLWKHKYLPELQKRLKKSTKELKRWNREVDKYRQRVKLMKVM